PLAGSARPSAAALSRSGGAAPDRRPVAPGNRTAHGHQPRHRLRTSRPRHVRAGRTSLWRKRIGTQHMSERANDISREAATWLERREREDWSDADNSALETWLAQSPAHKLAFWRVKGACSQTERLN